VSEWQKLPPIQGGVHPCLCCGAIAAKFPSDGRVAVGFGMAALQCDGAVKWQEAHDMEWEDCITGAQAEAFAAADPDHDWRIVIHGPLSGRTYQRHAEGELVLVEKNMGFA
jgi:hypothetical protein